MRQLPGALLGSILVAGALFGSAGCASQAATDKQADNETPLTPVLVAGTDLLKDQDDPGFTKGTKNLLPPELFDRSLVVAVGTPPAEPIQQPIAFPHDRHVKVLGMDCQYCHSGARKGIHAGVPPTQVCMGCHAQVPSEGRPELDKLKDYFAKGENIPWVKVHDLPDYVYFSHKRHVLGGVQCRECHGEVQDMTVDQRVAPLTMGWCLDCHAQNENIDKNYGAKAELRRAELKDCWTCHK